MITMPANVSHYGGTRAVDVDALTTALLSGATITARGTHYTGSGILVPLRPEEHGELIGHWQLTPLTRMHVANWVRYALPDVTAVGMSPWRYLHSTRDTDGTLSLTVVEAFSDADETEALAAARARGVARVWHAGRRQWIPAYGFLFGEVA